VQTVRDLVEARAAAPAARPALFDAASGATASGPDLWLRTRARARALAAAGARPGDRIALLLPNAPATVETLLAVASLGAAAVPINLRWRAAEVEHLLQDAAPTLLVADREHLAALGTLRGLPPVVDVASPLAAATAFPTPSPEPGDAALVLYTSGTTGRPKGAVLTHANLLSNARAIVDWLGLGPDDRMLTVMPLFHANAIVIGTLCPLLAGGASIVADAFHTTSFWSTVARFRATAAGTVPTMLTMLLGRTEPSADALASVRFLLTGSAPVPAEVVTRMQSRFGLSIVEGYGLTECTCRATFNPADGRHRPGSCGLPLERLRIVDADDRPVATGAVGEVQIAGPHVMREYLGRPGETAAALRDGWLRTGDLARADADGFVSIVGRASDLIIRGGENVYPREIEDVLHRHADVVEAAVTGAPDPLYGEVVAAFVVLRPGANTRSDALRGWCREHLADYKCPVAVHLVDDLPKGPTGKILKRPLRDRLARS
jgi:acyl-CoA synthetase (AMP-forming)/AMP-acid ligase II